MKRTINRWTTSLHNYLATAQRLSLAALCSLLLVSSSLAQEQRPEPPTPQPPTPEAATTPKAPDPNETLTPSPLASQVVDGDIIFTSPGQFTYPRDIRLSDNFGGLRFFGADSLTTSPAGAAIQFFGNNANNFNGQLYLDSGAFNSAALIFRTAPTGGTITERMRVRSDGNVGIGTTDPNVRLHVVGTGGSSITSVLGENFNSNGRGVYGLTTGSTAIGVYGSNNSNGTGVFGISSSGRGVYGYSSGGGVGVFGESPGFQGVFGYSFTGTGVYGASDNGFAGYFGGRVNVNGNLTKSSGQFKIDHPLDPENKYLSHSFVESPDMMNIYNGNVVLDGRGRATITMPAYFAALNREFRYQLTAIGAPANLYVAAEIKGNTFKIAGGKRGMKVSWQVTGIRQDAYAEQHRIQVEEEKTGEERGTYLHPEAFGQPKEKGVARVQQPESNQRLTAASAQRREN